MQLKYSIFSIVPVIVKCDRQTHDDSIYCASIASCVKSCG